MQIAVDFDGTFTEDPMAWAAIINIMQRAGHSVVCITSRRDTPAARRDMSLVLPHSVPVYFAYGMTKQACAEMHGLTVTVWVDDCPASICGVILPSDMDTDAQGTQA